MKPLLFLLLATIGCSHSRNISTLREAVDQARVSIAEMAIVAEHSMSGGRALTAQLRVRGGVATYTYSTLGAGSLHDIEIDTLDGSILSSAVSGAGVDGCPGAISLAEAIAIAETQITDGTVIAAIPDDDVACAREIQVLAPDLLWEVKVAGDGAVVEVEESDETED